MSFAMPFKNVTKKSKNQKQQQKQKQTKPPFHSEIAGHNIYGLVALEKHMCILDLKISSILAHRLGVI